MSAWGELGNFAVERGERVKALDLYQRAWKGQTTNHKVQTDIMQP